MVTTGGKTLARPRPAIRGSELPPREDPQNRGATLQTTPVLEPVNRKAAQESILAAFSARGHGEHSAVVHSRPIAAAACHTGKVSQRAIARLSPQIDGRAVQRGQVNCSRLGRSGGRDHGLRHDAVTLERQARCCQRREHVSDSPCLPPIRRAPRRALTSRGSNGSHLRLELVNRSPEVGEIRSMRRCAGATTPCLRFASRCR